MMTLVLGSAPVDLRVLLQDGAGFHHGLTTTDGTPWPQGANITLEWSTGQTWVAAIAGTVAMWQEDAAAVHAVLTLDPSPTVRLWYTPPSGDRILWAVGRA